MIPHDEELKDRSDLERRQHAIEKAAEDVIEALKKNGARMEDLEEVFSCVRVILYKREI